MKIGIISPSDIRYFSGFFSDVESKEILEQNAQNIVATAVHTLILSLLEDGNFVRLFTLSKKAFVIKGDNLQIYGITKFDQYPLKFLGGDFVNVKRLKAVVKSNISDLDVLHAHWTYNYALAASSFTKQIPVFCTVRDWASYIWKIESAKNKIFWSVKYLINELVFRNKDIHFISNSPYTANRIEKKYGIKTPIIPNPIKESFLFCQEKVIPKNLELLCVSSSHDKRKNVTTLLQAFQRVLSIYPDAHLSLVGAPFTDNNESMGVLKSQGLLNNVSLIGSVTHEELKKYFDRARIFISPSLEETFGNTLLESMARKVPIIAGQSSGAIPFVLKQGEVGFLCDVSKVDKIVEAITFVYENPNKAAATAKLGFELLFSDYLGEKVKQKHIELYQVTLGRGAGK